MGTLTSLTSRTRADGSVAEPARVSTLRTTPLVAVPLSSAEALAPSPVGFRTPGAGSGTVLPLPRTRGTSPTPAVVPPAAGRPTGTDPASGTKPQDIAQLTGLRFVAAVWVLLLHASYIPGDVFSRWTAPIAPLVAAGPLGVDLFFVLSGLVLTRSYLARMGTRPSVGGTARFLRARIARVWPLYAAVTVAFGCWCAARLVFGRDGIVAWQTPQPSLGPLGWIRQLTMTQMWTSSGIEGVSFVLPAWSVSAEWLAYLCFPLLVLGAWRIRSWPLPVLSVLAVLAASPVAVVPFLTAGSGESGAWVWLLRIAGGFTAGMLTWLVVDRLPRTPVVELWAGRLVLAVLAETVLVAYWAASAPATASVPAADRLWLAVPMFPVLLGALCVARGRLVDWLSSPRLQHGGRISYAIYLVHFPLIEITVVAMTRFPALAPNSSLAALAIPHVLVASVLLAHLAYRWIEEPARGALTRR
ncbi:acyltransferase [Actinomycetospora corticicola]|uniref:Peptidoglycan/LPS O-acetylase OafA/YrhL n=1 Tax=Actinomycetospora corticicola TaxID=663602 RepID=A0A7Y9J7Z0_9PSEU|nr:acyltransferase [Actinomycetospora corticicola]NYD38526.1 peptidoglycan/LPS O-acetylase OafA/YrhL [Actinomycetospora corticicola]